MSSQIAHKPVSSFVVGTTVATDTASVFAIIIITLTGIGLGFFIGIFINIIGGGLFSYIISIQQSLENTEKYLKYLAVEKKKSEVQKEPDLTLSQQPSNS